MRVKRKRRGSQIAELAPSLVILLLVVLFPMLDIMYLGIGYAGGWYLNQMTARALATTEPTDWPTAASRMTTAWQGSSLANFTGASVVSNGSSNATGGTLSGGDKYDKFVQVNTEVRINPFISLASVPFLNALSIDGLTKPVTFRYVDKRPREELSVSEL
ncbi:MAG: hypothetical protein LCH63_04290 [Candidatus Melainabacteria bacterium]|jgi:hypothetical protein|uniref:Uncharacterized protein n=1 Tax=Candidatus Obscuribacter phosphatis TaxID=1906157 RepID=A0A8J7PDX2_9BACT|nr:hypothetical protein [Candidatus Obscuribacter phosphatis]MCA0313045.1 hypothetical protein [Candidatus Melainabacteria bacterium]